MKSKLMTIYQHEDGRIELQSNNGGLSISKDKKTIFFGRRNKKLKGQEEPTF